MPVHDACLSARAGVHHQSHDCAVQSAQRARHSRRRRLVLDSGVYHCSCAAKGTFVCVCVCVCVCVSYYVLRVSMCYVACCIVKFAFAARASSFLIKGVIIVLVGLKV